MAIYSGSSSRWPNFRSLAILCVIGAFCGLLYSYVFFGVESSLFIAGALSGAMITFFYGLMEIIIFPKSPNRHSISSQYFLRISCYFVLFLLSLLLVSLLHAHFSSLYNDVFTIDVFKEDYLPFWPAYFTYSLLAAFVFQSIWLFNKVKAKNNNVFPDSTDSITTFNGSVFIIGLLHTEDISQERFIKILDLISAELTGGKENVIEYYEDGKLKVYFGKNSLKTAEITAYEQKLYNVLQSHISNNEKMLQLRIGYGYGEIQVQVCGSQTLFYGEAVQKAEANLKIITHSTQSMISPTFAFPFII